MIKFLKEHPHWIVLLGGIALLPVIRWLGILVIIAALVAALGHFEDRVEVNSIQWDPDLLGLLSGIALFMILVALVAALVHFVDL